MTGVQTCALPICHRFGADHSPIRNDADTSYRKPAPQSLNDRNKRLNVGRAPRPHLRTDRMAMFIQDDPYHHLTEVGAMILTVAQLADRLATITLEVDGGGIEKDAIQTGKKIPALKKHILLDQVLYTARREGCAVLLIFQLFSQKAIAR